MSRRLVLVCAATAVAASALADVPRTANLETASSLAEGAAYVSLEYRGLTDTIEFDHGAFEVGYGLSGELTLVVRGAAARRGVHQGNNVLVLHGGEDYEALVKFAPERFEGLAVALGVGFPETAAQKSAALTVQGVYEFDATDRLTLLVSPKALFKEDDPIVGVGLGATYRFAEGWYVAADYTAVVSGDNTRDPLSGAAEKGDVWGALIMWRPEGTENELFMGLSNALGRTTGLSLTPNLDDRPMVVFGVTFRT